MRFEQMTLHPPGSVLLPTSFVSSKAQNGYERITAKA